MAEEAEATFAAGMSTPEDVVAALIAYGRAALVDTLRNDLHADVRLRAMGDDAFSASVFPRGPDAFEVRIAAGVAKDLITALNVLPALVEEPLAALSQSLFDDPDQIDVIKGCLVGAGVLFILLHEFGHIAAGHFVLFPEAAFDEVRSRFAWDGEAGPEAVNKLVELEADIYAFNVLLDLAVPVFEANTDVQTLRGDREFEDWRERIPEPLIQLMFYASVLALALLDAHRRDAGGTNAYPLPFTRALNLAGLMVRRGTDADWATEGDMHRLAMNEDTLKSIGAVALPALADGLILCQAGCAALGLDLDDRLGLGPGELAWRTYANDFINLLRGAPDPFVTREGRELQGLKAEDAAFTARMRPHRRSPHWT